MSSQSPERVALRLPPQSAIALVAARFNAPIVDALLDGCIGRIKELGGEPTVHRVPGAFELPLAARWLAQTRRYSAVICLGAVVRGDTPHFDYVAGECARGIMDVMLQEKLPVIFGVLTTNTEQQARDRTGGPHGHAGERAADAAAEMIALGRDISAST